MTEKDYWLGFATSPGIGPKKFQLLLTSFKSAKKAWVASEKELQSVLGDALANKFIKFRQGFNLENYLKYLEKKDVWYITHIDKEYPERLKEIDNPPFVLFGRGDSFCLSEGSDKRPQSKAETADLSTPLRSAQGKSPFIGVVGTRKVTNYGKQVTEMITRDLVDAGCIIVSGLALGVDAIAHKTTIDNKGKTIAVLGCGVDCCYPSSNEKIYDEIIAADGAIISEFPPSMPPSVGSFPSRNRIIAGISEAVVVTEGAEDSGSLITAHNALDFGRKVFAVPGPITSSLSQGPLKLLQKGAVLVTSGKDIIDSLGITSSTSIGGTTRIIKGDNEEEQKIIDVLQNESLIFDELVRKTRLDTSKLSVLLSVMEIKGMINRSPTGDLSLGK